MAHPQPGTVSTLLPPAAVQAAASLTGAQNAGPAPAIGPSMPGAPSMARSTNLGMATSPVADVSAGVAPSIGYTGSAS